jgi:asparagine synthase (glutamine-hydrolysing)
VAFSGGIDSTVFLLARKDLQEQGGDPNRVRAFTLDLGGGKDAEQAADTVRALGFEDSWEVVRVPAERLNLQEAVNVIEDYHPLDVECAAAALCLLEGIRERYPSLKYLLDGDGGDENLKSYPLEDSDLTLSSVLRNPMCIRKDGALMLSAQPDVFRRSVASYVRTYAPAAVYGFNAFSPYTVRSVIAAALAIPFDTVLEGSVERLYTLKQEVVSCGVRAVTGVAMPAHPKRRFQDGAGESYRRWRVSKSWCRQVFLRQWQERLQTAAQTGQERRSGNEMLLPTEAFLASRP